ncbi:MAG: EamA family transporter [Candidatus Omnitrophica bacterium]|nr:EamA family transporter [Candidatus Omnitrophota bacterium]
MVKILLLVLLAELVTVVGQILFKKAANQVEPYSLRGIAAQLRFMKDILTKPAIWLGLLAMILGLVIWLAALAQGDLSLVFSLGSMQYILILFLAHVFLGEKIDKMKFIGTFLVVLGIVLIAMT